MEKKIAIIGIGNCGSQVADLAEKQYSSLIDSIYINTSDSDLSTVNGSMKFKIGQKEEIEGSGKNRLKMKGYLKENLNTIIKDKSFIDCIVEKKFVFIVVSAAGGTGSGAGPVFLDIMKVCFPDVHFILVAVLPQIQASLMEQGNALEFLHELYNELDKTVTYMIYDNETTTGNSPTEALEIVNKCIVEDIRILSGIDNYATPYDSIDEADLESIITTPGRLLVTRIQSGLTEKVMEEVMLDDLIIKHIKQSCHAETDRNKRVVRWGIITYFTSNVNKLYTTNLGKLTDFIGTPIEKFNHHAVHDGKESLNFFYLIAAGLSPINDRVKRINDRIEELKDALAGDETNEYILNSTSVAYDVLEARKKEMKRNKVNDVVKPQDLFDKFMK